MQSDYDRLSFRLSELWTLLNTKIREHSQLLKAAEKANWEKSATEKADYALAEIHILRREFSDLVQFAEQQLTADGYAFPPEPKPITDQPERWWKKDTN